MTREEAIQILADLTDNPFLHTWEEQYKALHMAIEALSAVCDDCIWNVCNYNKVDWDAPSAEAETNGDMGEVTDGYHTFNQLYHQRAVLFATIVKQNKEKAWKSWKHGDGKFCFDSNKEWFIVGVDTPEGSYTYHYEKKYWDMFDCAELEHGKFWDGHTEEDVTRLLSLPSAEAVSREDYHNLLMASNDIDRALREYQAKDENPPVEAEWIPCSERLPSDSGNYLITVADLRLGHNGEHTVTMADFYAKAKKWNSVVDVVAWMPLQEPYKGGDDECTE